MRVPLPALTQARDCLAAASGHLVALQREVDGAALIAVTELATKVAEARADLDEIDGRLAMGTYLGQRRP